jgi:replicative DNA helicase
MVIPINGSALQSTTASARPELPMSIAPGGHFETILARARQSVYDSGAALHLNGKLGSDLQNLRAAYLSAQLDSCLTPIDRLMAAIQNRSMTGEAGDPVLRYSLALHENLDPKKFGNLFDRAAQNYEPAFKAYQANLGDLIPSDLTEIVNSKIAQVAYKKGTHSTSLEDWNVFQMALAAYRRRGPRMPKITTGLPTLDSALDGLQGLNFIVGDKGVGKTALLVFIAYAVLKENPLTTVLFYSLDMNKHRIYERLYSLASEVDYRLLHDPNPPPEINDRLARANERLQYDFLPRLRVQERHLTGSRNLDFPTVRGHMNELLDASKGQSMLVMFDLFQRIDVQRFMSNDNREMVPVEISDNDKDHARLDLFKQIQEWSRSPVCEDGFPILVASEVRKGDSAKRLLTCDDLLGASRLASDADTVLLLSPGDQVQSTDAQDVPLNLRIGKGRDGVDRSRELTLWFRHARTQFFDVDPAKSTEAAVGRVRRQIPRTTSGGAST